MATAAWRLRVGRRGVLLLIVCLVLLAANSGLQAAAGDPMEKVGATLLEEMASKGEATFFVVLKQKADLRPAHGISNRTERGVFVHQRLQAVAEQSQAALRRWLADRGVSHKSFWIVNAIRVTGDEALLGELAARPEVDRIVLEGGYEIPKPEPGSEEALVDAVGVEHRPHPRAPGLVRPSATRGEGIVVANIDTGVQFDHPALVAAVPRQPAAAAASTTTTTGSTRPASAAARRSCPATTTATAPTPWAPWSATTATGANQIGVAPARAGGSRPRAASRNSCSDCGAARPPASGSSRRPT